MKQSKMLNNNLKPEHKKNTNGITMSPKTHIDRQEPTIWNGLRKSVDRPTVMQLKREAKLLTMG